MSIQKAILSVVVTGLCASIGLAQEEKKEVEESYRAFGVAMDHVSIKAKTNEGMGWVGRGEGIASIAVASLASSVGTS